MDLRARYPVRTPDALQIAAALSNGCQAFLTNDKRLKPVSELKILVLDDIL
jgi:predicted nucleic acid-binding protein